jgi:hypothetical protein
MGKTCRRPPAFRRGTIGTADAGARTMTATSDAFPSLPSPHGAGDRDPHDPYLLPRARWPSEAGSSAPCGPPMRALPLAAGCRCQSPVMRNRAGGHRRFGRRARRGGRRSGPRATADRWRWRAWRPPGDDEPSSPSTSEPKTESRRSTSELAARFPIGVQTRQQVVRPPATVGGDAVGSDAAGGGAERRSAKNADRPLNQSCEAHRSARPLHSPEGGHALYGGSVPDAAPGSAGDERLNVVLVAGLCGS